MLIHERILKKHEAMPFSSIYLQMKYRMLPIGNWEQTTASITKNNNNTR